MRLTTKTCLLAASNGCFFFLGGSSWVLINGIYAQIPFIITVFSGDYTVVSKITFCVTLSSLFPIVLSVLSKRLDGTYFIEGGIGVILILGLGASASLAVWTPSHLVSLLAVTAAGGIVGSASSILYYPYAASTLEHTATSPSKHQTTALLLGTATGNLFVACLVMLQEHSDDTNNQPRIFFETIAVMHALAFIGFFGTLVISRIGKAFYGQQHPLEINPIVGSFIEDDSNNIEKSSIENLDPSHAFWKLSKSHRVLHGAQFVLNALVFFLPGIVPYSVRDCTQDEAQNGRVLQILVVLQLLAQTVGVVVASSYPIGGRTKDAVIRCQLWIVFLVLWVPLVSLCGTKQTPFGTKLPVFLNTALNFAYTYCNTSWFHLLTNQSNGSATTRTSAARVMGTWHQLGATLGSAVAFEVIRKNMLTC